jgi:archaellum component FlaC
MILSDEALCKQLEEYAGTLGDIPDFLDQVKERIELLKEEAGTAGDTSKDYQEELERLEAEHREQIRVLVAEVSHDQAILIDWALDSGADPGAVKGLKSAMTAGAVETRAKARAAF